MRKLLALLLLTVLIGPVVAEVRQVPLSEVRENDEGYYLFFSTLLKLSGEALEDVAEENLNSTLPQRIQGIINATLVESQLYGSSRIEDFLPPFITLGEGIMEISDGQRMILNSTSLPEKLSGLSMMSKGVEKCEISISEISGLKFKMSNGTFKYLDVSKVKDELDKVKDLVRTYSFILQRREGKEFVLYTSDLNPFVLENVSFYGFAPNFSRVTIFIGNESLEAELRNDRFYANYTFLKPGLYRVYALGVKENKSLVTSNSLTLNVTRISTRIVVPRLVTARIFENFTVNGSLVDYYGRYVSGSIFVNGKELRVNGTFSIRFSFSKYGNYSITIFYPGSEVYSPSKAEVKLTILRLPVNLSISVDKDKVRKGESIRVEGNISLGGVPVKVCVDEECFSTLSREGKFNATVKMNETGSHEIYAVFEGSELYEPAKSNVVEVEVYSYPILEVSLVLASLFLGYLLLNLPKRRRRGIIVDYEEIKALLKEEKKEEIERRKGIRDYYRNLYFRLIKTLNLSRSTTPRELLSLFKGKEIYEGLREVTLIHERSVYGMKRLRVEEVKRFFRALASVIISLILGEGR
ncbi:Ig-like domain-containing protein [Pyrococcus horikoshii]|nr:Ig-like domain-containing protein [Pyrococcus horikoshii]HII61043.1 Ig-like domain repeat protein [Pyrococcus horikoshii]